MFQQLISEADLAVNQAIKRQDPRNYVMIRKCLNKLISCDGIYFSGHRIMGISFHDSALHVYIELEDSYYRSLCAKVAKECISFLEEKLDEDHENWDIKNLVQNRRNNPSHYAIWALFKPAKIECCITFKSGLGIANTNILRHLLYIQPEATKLYFAVKIFLVKKGITLREYVVSLMVIFYLQRINLLPSIELIQKKSRAMKSVLIEGYECQFDNNLTCDDYGVKKMDDLKQNPKLFSGFFEFYAAFDYKSNIISPFTGWCVIKGLKPEPQWVCSMSIAGPIVRDKNVAHNFSRSLLRKFIKVCEEST